MNEPHDVATEQALADALRDAAHAKDRRNRARLNLPPYAFASARRAWEGGSGLLGLWLSGYKEQTTGKRNFTTAEYGELVDIVAGRRLHSG